MKLLKRLALAVLLGFAGPAAAIDYYTASGDPVTGSSLSSSVLRAEYSAIAAGFVKIAPYTSNGGKILAINAGGTAQEAITTTGTGSGVRATSPTLVTPVLGVATITSINKITLTQPATGATLTLTDGKTLAATNTLTLSGTDSTVMTFPTTSATIARTDAANTFTGVQTLSSQPILSSLTASLPVFSDGSKGLVSNTMTGTGSVVMSTSPSFVTSVIGGASIDVFNTVSTTVNAFGAAETLNIGKSSVTSVLATPGTLEWSGTTASVTHAGGLYVAKKGKFGGDLATAGTLAVTGALTGSGDILSDKASAGNIGMASNQNLSILTGGNARITITNSTGAVTIPQLGAGGDRALRVSAAGLLY